MSRDHESAHDELGMLWARDGKRRCLACHYEAAFDARMDHGLTHELRDMSKRYRWRNWTRFQIMGGDALGEARSRARPWPDPLAQREYAVRALERSGRGREAFLLGLEAQGGGYASHARAARWLALQRRQNALWSSWERARLLAALARLRGQRRAA